MLLLHRVPAGWRIWWKIRLEKHFHQKYHFIIIANMLSCRRLFLWCDLMGTREPTTGVLKCSFILSFAGNVASQSALGRMQCLGCGESSRILGGKITPPPLRSSWLSKRLSSNGCPSPLLFNLLDLFTYWLIYFCLNTKAYECMEEHPYER